ncbi:aminotransferase class I/II-fold pyridoxal phosphate-dependent enzyme [Nonomuraea sp. KC401]|uniref:aminotransferase class I/II-fold pyridoxal phosphate-dependent enzyme n=1 Tax=unclassified Nonomuraea TaxID=2593643 RepID=UPI0010FCED7A|nr:aminotransferase class I/II-fold pyridoxal phosphate-dependent enzyme [Nonomuraea sp. KC401]NBE93814.1 aminotransferase class I/II-fold pyridoxal phosphate-dependent enzyme [Nonomuraea sp. K271]TLF80680.1 aminotransferase class I/II-fold pyridoxal phosphate-dependent enzyme [Nonomuraea sp. KC401]
MDAAWLAERIGEPSARGIATVLTDLIREGTVTADTRLPTVRALARELRVSSGTVAEAWSELRRHGMIRTDRRRGTVVLGPPDVPRPIRYERIGHFGDRLAIDLAIASPDPALLPPLEAALSAAAHADRLNDYTRETITPRLRAAVEPDWPFPAQGWLAVGGGYEGVQLLCQTAALPGDRIAIEEPTAARLLDILETIGVQIVPVACDENGPLPGALAKALRARPVAFVYQPRGQSPCGHAVTPERSAELAALLEPTATLIVEDDGIGALSVSPTVSMGARFPDRTVLVRSYSKSHGPDLRIAVVGGAAEAVERVRVLRSFGTGWTSRILQDALAHLLDDSGTRAGVERARAAYAGRRARLAAELSARGVRTGGRDGLVLWVPVRDEPAALVTLAAHGISAAPGSRYVIGPVPAHHLRLATARLTDDPGELAELADVIALAATGSLGAPP